MRNANYRQQRKHKVVEKSRHTLGRNERLKRRKYIEELFNSGESFSIYPLRIYYALIKEENTGHGITSPTKNSKESILQFGGGVSKKNFKKSVDRNRIKRLIREAYRIQKADLREAASRKKESSLKLFILYTGKEIPNYLLIKEKVGEALTRLQSKIK